MTERAEGYYWIRQKSQPEIWIIVEYWQDARGWFICGSEIDLDEDAFLEISPRLTPPDEKKGERHNCLFSMALDGTCMRCGKKPDAHNNTHYNTHGDTNADT